MSVLKIMIFIISFILSAIYPDNISIFTKAYSISELTSCCSYILIIILSFEI